MVKSVILVCVLWTAARSGIHKRVSESVSTEWIYRKLRSDAVHIRVQSEQSLLYIV
jgi:hypothetical protein